MKRREYRKAAEKRYRDSLRGYIAQRRCILRIKRAFWESRLKETA